MASGNLAIAQDPSRSAKTSGRSFKRQQPHIQNEPNKQHRKQEKTSLEFDIANDDGNPGGGKDIESGSSFETGHEETGFENTNSNSNADIQVQQGPSSSPSHLEGNEREIENEDDEPDWDTIAEHEPTRNDVPRFLTARDRRDKAEARFAAALDDAHARLRILIGMETIWA